MCFSVFPYTVRKLGRVVNETQPGEAGAWPGRVVVRALMKWGGYGLVTITAVGSGATLPIARDVSKVWLHELDYLCTA
jgi:hypothetical protein